MSHDETVSAGGGAISKSGALIMGALIMKAGGTAAAMGLVTLAMLLGGCGQSSEQAAAAETQKASKASLASPEPSSSDTSNSKVAYKCSNGKQISASYGPDPLSPDKQLVDLVIDGQAYRLAEEVSASGAKYVADKGPTPGKRIVWWVKDGAAWFEGPLNQGQEVEVLVAECSEMKP